MKKRHMTNINKIYLSFLSSLLLLLGMNLYGQNDLFFSYRSSEDIKWTTNVIILLKSPDKEVFNLFTDTVKEYNYSGDNYFLSKGKYSLSIWYVDENNVKDSIDYDFELYGNEMSTKISVSFDYMIERPKRGNNFSNSDKILYCYIRVNKIYTPPVTIEIELDTTYKGDAFKGPVFKIKNNSNDTLYGEHLPGYFWGSLSYLRNDSIVATESGILDLNFVRSPPLYPDSTKFALVGSFGFSNKLSPSDY